MMISAIIMLRVIEEMIAIFFALFASIFSPILNKILFESIMLQEEYKIVDEIRNAMFEKSVLNEIAEWLFGKNDMMQTDIVPIIIIGTKTEFSFKINLKPFITTIPQIMIEIIDQRWKDV